MSSSRAVLPRPVLLPGLPRVWRGPRTLQLGLSSRRSVVLELPDPRVARLLDLLDGTRTERKVLARAAGLGLAGDDTRYLLDRLREAGLLLSAQQFLPAAVTGAARRRLALEATSLALAGARPGSALKRRVAARVAVSGRGRLGASVAVALAEAGIGHVDADLVGAVTEDDLPGGPLRAGDVGLSQRMAVAAAVERAVPGTITHRIRRGFATAIVQLGHGEPVSVVAAGHAARRQAHLYVAVRDGVAVVGPFVPAVGGPCLQCLELHRGDLDEGWPGSNVQVAPESCSVAALLSATAYATAEVLAFVDGGRPATVGAAVEITSPVHTRWRRWPPHPRCGCMAARRTTSPQLASGLLPRKGADGIQVGG